MQESYFYVGKVTDNQDKESLYRIKILAQLEGESVLLWLPYLSAVAGNRTGISSLSNINDQMLILAFGREREEQVVFGSFRSDNCAPPKNSGDKDADLNADGKNSLFFLIKGRQHDYL